MLKMYLVCAFCKKEHMAYDWGDATVKIDFVQLTIEFPCPSCGETNILNIGEIESLLKKKIKLPSIGGARL